MDYKDEKENERSIVDSSKMITIQYEKYNPTNIKSKFQNNLIFNHIYQHSIFHNINSNEEIPPSMNVKIQSLPGTGNIYSLQIQFGALTFVYFQI